MKKQYGFSLSEILISLFLSSIILSALAQFYLSSKRHYIETESLLAANLELQWISDLLSDSIRRAGFTPCLGIEHLELVDRRDERSIIHGLYIENQPEQFIQVNRMSEYLAKVIKISGSIKIAVSHTTSFHRQRPVIIADCKHAEVHQIARIEGSLITLTKPLLFEYDDSASIGDFLEERWFIKKNARGKNTLHYRLTQTEELSSLVHSLHTIKKKQLIEVNLGLEQDKTQKLFVAVRGS